MSKKNEPVKLTKGNRSTTATKPSTVTELKSQGWKVEKPKAPAPKPAPKGDD